MYKKSSGERDISFSINGAMPYDVIMYDPAKQPSVEGTAFYSLKEK